MTQVRVPLVDSHQWLTRRALIQPRPTRRFRRDLDEHALMGHTGTSRAMRLDPRIAVANPSRSRTTMRTIRALVADKSPALRRWYSAALRRTARDVVECEDGWELLFHLCEEPSYDLVVASKNLPGIGGARLLTLLRGAGVQLPFVLVAPFSDSGTRALVGKVPGAALVEDPLDSVRLADAAETLLAARPRDVRPEQVRRALAIVAANRASRPRAAVG